VFVSGLLWFFFHGMFQPLRRMAREASQYVAPGPQLAAKDEIRTVGVYIDTLKADARNARSSLEQTHSHLQDAEKLATIGRLASGFPLHADDMRRVIEFTSTAWAAPRSEEHLRPNNGYRLTVRRHTLLPAKPLRPRFCPVLGAAVEDDQVAGIGTGPVGIAGDLIKPFRQACFPSVRQMNQFHFDDIGFARERYRDIHSAAARFLR
jgi:hypothetical protein